MLDQSPIVEPLEDKWSRIEVRQRLIDGFTPLRVLNNDETLYVAVAGTKVGAVNLLLATEEEVWILLFEPQDIHHTGGVESDRTVEHSDHI